MISLYADCAGVCAKRGYGRRQHWRKRWKERNIKTWYYTTNLHRGAFMLPKYVEDMLEEEEA